MMRILFKHILLLAVHLLAISPLLAQDTLILMDRKPILVQSFHIEGEDAIYVKAGQKKERKIEVDKIYSLRSPGKAEQVVYRMDTLENNWYTAAQMADYIHGQEDARTGYIPQARKTGAGGFIFGFGGSAAGLFYGPLFPIIYTGWKGYTKPKFTKENGFNEQFKDNPYYTEGFGTTAKRMVNVRSAAGSASGFILGVVTLTLVLN